MPPAFPHGELKQLFDDIFFVQGTCRVAMGPVPMCFSRNMTIVRNGESLTLINSLRLDESGLAALDRLGRVEHVIRIAGFHGMDDPFYADRYGARVWAVRGQPYVDGFDALKTPDKTYFSATDPLDAGEPLPLADARLITFEGARVPEGVILLERDGGILVTGDSLQNWGTPDKYFNWPGRVIMRFMGFFRPYNLGPGWLKVAKPTPSGLAFLLDLSFEHVLPVHGEPVLGAAKDAFRPTITAMTQLPPQGQPSPDRASRSRTRSEL